MKETTQYKTQHDLMIWRIKMSGEPTVQRK